LSTKVPPDRKRRTREHVLADLSSNYVERFALRCGFAVRKLSPDYGLDLEIVTFDDNGYVESGVLWLQLKATDHLKTSRDGNAVLVRIEWRDILTWLVERYPVILVLYDAVRDRAYYLWIQEYCRGTAIFARLSGKTITVPVPTANLVNEEAIRGFAHAKRALFPDRRRPR
jgi:hypothetical protein